LSALSETVPNFTQEKRLRSIGLLTSQQAYRNRKTGTHPAKNKKQQTFKNGAFRMTQHSRASKFSPRGPKSSFQHPHQVVIVRNSSSRVSDASALQGLSYMQVHVLMGRLTSFLSLHVITNNKSL
jgi:hypothetical protein